MKKFQNIYGVIEKFFFIIAAVVIIAYASGYKYDYTKKELVQTGVLELNNIEDNADISFNGNVYQNKNNLTVSFLDQRAYPISIEKTDHKKYSTSVNILQGEVKFINPVLIPNSLKSFIAQSKVLAIDYNLDSAFYIYKDINSTYIERISINKTIVGLNINTSKIDITKDIKDSSVFSFFHTNNRDLAIFSINKSILIANFDKLEYQTLNTNSLTSITNIFTLGDKIIIQTIDSLYYLSLNSISAPQIKFTQSKKFLTVNDENNNLYIFDYSKNNVILNKYDSNLNFISKSDINTQNVDILSPTQLIYYNKNIYFIQDKSVYKIKNNQLEILEKNVIYYNIIDQDTLFVETSSKVLIYYKDKIYNYNISNNMDIKSIKLLPDLFTYFYCDNKNKLHLGDFGGQDNILEENVGPSILTGQTSSNIDVFYNQGSSLLHIRFGNNT